MTNILVSNDETLRLIFQAKLGADVVFASPEADFAALGSESVATSIIYDESTASLTRLATDELLANTAANLIVLTEKREWMLNEPAAARVFSYPLDLDSVLRHIRRLDERGK